MSLTQITNNESYGIKVSKVGDDVKGSAEAQLLYSSGKQSFNVIYKGSVWINFPLNATYATDVTVELEVDNSYFEGEMLVLAFGDVYGDGTSRLLQFQGSLISNYIGLYFLMHGGFIYEPFTSITFYGVRVPTAGIGDYPADMDYQIHYYVMSI